MKMFDQDKVCKYLLRLYIERNPETKGKIIGEIIREIRNRPVVKQGYSSKEIKGFVNLIVSEGTSLIKREDERADFVKKKVTELSREFQTTLRTWNFVISVENLRLHPRSVKVGNVMLFKFTPSRQKETRTRMWRLIKDNPHYDTKWKKNHVKNYEDKFLSSLKDKTCAFVQVKGRLEKAQLTAYDKVETAIAVLKLYRFRNYDFYRKYFHLTGKTIRATNRYTLRYSEDGQRINPMIERVGFFFPFELNNERIQYMRRNGFPKLHKMLMKENPSGLERRIVNSVRLFGSACDVIVTKSRESRPIGLGFPPKKESKPETTFEAISMNDRLIKLFVALESLLILDENEPLANNIAERGAFILGRNYEQRSEIKKFLKDMYGLRSAHIHHGKSEIEHPVLERFARQVQEIILRLVLNKDRLKLTTEEDLRNWFEKKKLS